MAKVTRICVECGKSFEVFPSQAAKKYCTWACRTAQPRICYSVELVEWSCGTCGKTEMRTPSSARENQYCSLACRPGRKRTGTTQPCASCGEPIYVHPCKTQRKRYCSRRCLGLGQPHSRVSKIEEASVDEWTRRHPHVPVVRGLRVSRWSIDLALADLKVAVEIDGVYWHSLPAMVEKDARKDAWLRSRGWTVHRIPVSKETPEQVADLIDREVAVHLIRGR